MKRLFLILTLLFVSVLTTACINNLAIQELNNKAKSYMEAGETEKAICRYKSSLDLDDNIFETNYNLGVAYISANKNEDAIDVLKKAIKINSALPDTYYSLAVAQEGAAYDIINGKDKEEDKCSGEIQEDETEINEPDKKQFTSQDKEKISKLFMESIDNYNQYLTLNPSAEDKDKVNNRINILNEELVKYTTPEGGTEAAQTEPAAED